MDSNIRTITGTGTIPAGTSIAGTITVSPDRADTAIYTGAVDLSQYITQGNSGVYGYCYLYCEACTTKISKITGAVQLDTTTWAIQTTGTLTGASASAFDVIMRPLYGYSFLGDGAYTVNGVAFAADTGDKYGPPDYADGWNIGETKFPLYVDALSATVTITEVLGAPSIA